MFHVVGYFLDKLCLEMLFEVIIYALETQIIAIGKKSKKRRDSQ